MSEVIDLSDVPVITKGMIMECVEEVIPTKGLASKSSNGKIVHRFRDIVALCLSRKKLHDIINLVYLTNLKTLRIDNNCLVSLEGLGKLYNLEWLDASCNRIDNLSVNVGEFQRLKNMNLSSNRIESICIPDPSVDGKEAYPCLNTLSVAGNLIAIPNKLESLKHLRSLVYLDASDNPCFKGTSSYEDFLARQLPHIKPLGGL